MKAVFKVEKGYHLYKIKKKSVTVINRPIGEILCGKGSDYLTTTQN